jgi:hypothetical protein
VKKQQKNEKKNPNFAECRHSAKLGTCQCTRQLCRVPATWRSAKIFSKKKLNYLCRVHSRAALGKEFYKKINK